MANDEPVDARAAEAPPRALVSDELIRRIASGIALAAFALAVLAWGSTPFALMTLAIAGAMSWEWGRIVRGAEVDIATVIHILVVAVAALLTARDMAGLAVVAVMVGSIAAAILVFGTGRSQLTGLGVLYTALPLISLGWLRSDDPLGFLATLFVLLIVAVTDIAAFVAGRSIGGPKLWPAISPNKTWSGLIGGVAAATIVGALFPLITGSGTWVWLAMLGLVMGVVSQAGDLAESALKRHFGLKDASGLIPGHGGFMDRMDGVVTASIVAALVAFAIDAYAPARALLYGS